MMKPDVIASSLEKGLAFTYTHVNATGKKLIVRAGDDIIIGVTTTRSGQKVVRLEVIGAVANK